MNWNPLDALKWLTGRSGTPQRPDLPAFADLHPGDVAIDAGANVGEVTAIMAKTGATVYAFEPNPHAFKVLQKKFAGQSNVHCLNQAVLDHAERLRLYFHQNARWNPVKWSNGSSLLPFKKNVNAGSYVEVEAVDLAEFIRSLGVPVKLLKMDVEGVECAIIEKLIDEGLMKNIGCLVAETHEDGIPELRERTGKLRARIKAEGLTNVNLDWI